ncbi:MAG: hypothetical protein IKY94_14110 [Lachnospiraceae bacterium]|nr:hypothetical protein [Lachnospiraceae bacterium]
MKNLKAQGKKIIPATCKLDEYAIAILKHFHLYEYFDFVAGTTMDGSRCNLYCYNSRRDFRVCIVSKDKL